MDIQRGSNDSGVGLWKGIRVGWESFYKLVRFIVDGTNESEFLARCLVDE
jgi:hypothetical protein